MTLCTDSDTSEEVNLFKNALENKFNISTTTHNKKGRAGNYYERIYILKKSLDELKPYLKEHMHDSMLYKINEVPLFENEDLDNIVDDFNIGDF